MKVKDHLPLTGTIGYSDPLFNWLLSVGGGDVTRGLHEEMEEEYGAGKLITAQLPICLQYHFEPFPQTSDGPLIDDELLFAIRLARVRLCNYTPVRYDVETGIYHPLYPDDSSTQRVNALNRIEKFLKHYDMETKR